MRRRRFEWAGSASIKPISTGLFLFNAFSFSDADDSNAIGAFNHKRPPTMNAWDVGQEFEKSGMHLYCVYQHFDSPELDLIRPHVRTAGWV